MIRFVGQTGSANFGYLGSTVKASDGLEALDIEDQIVDNASGSTRQELAVNLNGI